MLKNATVLIVDDEEIMREILSSLLTQEGFQVQVAASGEDALRLVSTVSFDVVLVDLMMPSIDGIQTLKSLKKLDKDLPVIMITAFGTTANTREAFKNGAFDFIEKPFKNDDVLIMLRNAVAQRHLVTENQELRRKLKLGTPEFNEIVGFSSSMQGVFKLITQAAPSRTTILVSGESGTGKELVARAIHTHSSRSNHPFITVNSGSLPPDLLESNLFGHVKGAFTGAVRAKKGLFEIANQGSIFFDEIGNIPLETQAKLLRVIQEREFMRLGGVETVKVDTRIIAATNVDLQVMVKKGLFREDLYYRLYVITIELPPLRERKEDIPRLVEHFLQKYGEENQKSNLVILPNVIRLLERYDWPGNVRELENVIERAVVLTSSNTINAELIPDSVTSNKPSQLFDIEIPAEGIPFKNTIKEIESMLIVRSLEAAGGIQKRAAELLQIKPTTLNEMIKRYGITASRTRTVTSSSEGSDDFSTK